VVRLAVSASLSTSASGRTAVRRAREPAWAHALAAATSPALAADARPVVPVLPRASAEGFGSIDAARIARLRLRPDLRSRREGGRGSLRKGKRESPRVSSSRSRGRRARRRQLLGGGLRSLPPLGVLLLLATRKTPQARRSLVSFSASVRGAADHGCLRPCRARLVLLLEGSPRRMPAAAALLIGATVVLARRSSPPRRPRGTSSSSRLRRRQPLARQRSGRPAASRTRGRNGPWDVAIATPARAGVARRTKRHGYARTLERANADPAGLARRRSLQGRLAHAGRGAARQPCVRVLRPGIGDSENAPWLRRPARLAVVSAFAVKPGRGIVLPLLWIAAGPHRPRRARGLR